MPIYRCGHCQEAKDESAFMPSQRKNGSWCRECFHADYLARYDERRSYIATWRLAKRGGHHDLICAYEPCGQPFIATGNDIKRGRRFCSKACFSKERRRLERVARLEAKPDRICVWCGEPLARSKRADAVFCSYACMDRAHVTTKNGYRRASDKRGQRPLIRFAEMGEAQAWRCGLCDEPINRRRKFPDPLSASIDHILPLASGGGNEVENLQLAHLGCNMSKRRILA